jgi:hypothetical protein
MVAILIASRIGRQGTVVISGLGYTMILYGYRYRPKQGPRMVSKLFF